MSNEINAIIAIIITILVYLIPSVVGANKESAAGITVLNIFLGWTLIGWVIALIWAVTSKVKK